VGRERHAPAPLLLISPGTYCREGSVGRRAGMESYKEDKISCSLLVRTPDRPAHSESHTDLRSASPERIAR